MRCIDTNTATLILLRQLGSGKCQFKRANANHVICLKILVMYLLRIDIDMIGTLQINDPITFLITNQACMMSGYLRMIEDNLVIWQTSHCDDGILQGNG